MAKALVTGGAGFIGSHITDRLIADGHDVVVLDNMILGKKEFLNEKAEFVKADIRDYDAVLKACEGVDVIFHQAAEPRLPLSIEDPIGTHEVNVTGTLNIFEAARNAGVKKVIFPGSAASYGDHEVMPLQEDVEMKPKSPYGLHKLMGEQYAKLYHDLYDLYTVVLRYFNVFGPRKTVEGGYPMVIPIFIDQKNSGKPMTIVGDGEATRDYVHVRDVVEANMLAWKSDVKNGTPINLCSGREVSVNEIAKLIGGETTNLPERKGEMMRIKGDCSRAKELLGWESSVEFEEGLKELL